MQAVTNETIFEYVRISGGEKTDDGNEIGSEIAAGGGMFIGVSNPILNHVTISGNQTMSSIYGLGGGICIYNASPTLNNVVISGNYAPAWGGGIMINGISQPNFNNVTIF